MRKQDEATAGITISTQLLLGVMGLGKQQYSFTSWFTFLGTFDSLDVFTWGCILCNEKSMQIKRFMAAMHITSGGTGSSSNCSSSACSSDVTNISTDSSKSIGNGDDFFLPGEVLCGGC